MANYGISCLSIVPVRVEPNDESAMVTQVLFGEHYKVVDKVRDWIKIRIAFDTCEGWIDQKLHTSISQEFFKKLEKETIPLSLDYVDFITNEKKQLHSVVLGSSLPFLKKTKVSLENYTFLFEGKASSKKQPKKNILNTAFMYLNTPYLLGGKTPFGIDCTGFTQMVYKLNGYKLLRQAHEQATQGEVLSFIEESEAGDLAFFDDKEGHIIHTGMIMPNNYIIHASGKVRIDRLDQSGIFNEELRKHTHKLRVIKKII